MSVLLQRTIRPGVAHAIFVPAAIFKPAAIFVPAFDLLVWFRSNRDFVLVPSGFA